MSEDVLRVMWANEIALGLESGRLVAAPGLRDLVTLPSAAAAPEEWYGAYTTASARRH